MKITSRVVPIFVLILASVGLLSQEQAAPAAQSSRAVGTVEAISGNSYTLKTDAGAEITVNAQGSTHVLRSEPGQKSLKDATQIQFSDIQPGDRTLLSGKVSADGKSIAATTIVVMKQGDIASKQAQEREDWQRRSVDGLVSAVDPAASTITISKMVMGEKKVIVIHVSPATDIRRYAPNSAKFDDAEKSSLAEVKPGDQLRARGNRNADGTEVSAEGIVSGTFRNVSGTVQSVDKAKNQLTVMDLATKKPVTVTIGGDSQMRKLPEVMAQRIAMRLKGGPAAGGPPGAGPGAGQQPPTGGGPGMGASGGAGPSGGGMRAGGGDMMQAIIARAPAVQLSDLQKGDAVVLIATEGSATTAPTAISLLAGVEPILTASPKGEASTILSPWNLGGGGGGDASAQ